MKKTKLTTTFQRLRDAGACQGGYRKLAKHLGGVDAYGMDKPINLLVILDSNGLDDTLWCLRATEQDATKIVRLFAADCAESVLHHYESLVPNDDRPRKAIQAARDHANGLIDDAARAAAWDAARAAAWAAAWDAAWAAAGAAAGAAAWAAARDAARDAAWGAARDAAWAAAWAAARDAARDAAWGAARAAARDAARDAENAEAEKQRAMLVRYLAADRRPANPRRLAATTDSPSVRPAAAGIGA